MLYMSSNSGNDGSYSLTVTFKIGTDLNMAQVLVQNRVQQALPLLPEEVQRQGLVVRKRTPDILMIANVYSPDNRATNSTCRTSQRCKSATKLPASTASAMCSCSANKITA